MSGRARTTIEESASTTPTARARAATRGRGAPLIAELLAVLAAVLVAFLQHLFDVGAGFREGDALDRQVRPTPLVGIAGAGVVGGHRRRLVAVVAIEQFAQEEGPVADVQFGVGQVRELEGRAAALLLDELCRFRGDLHQSPRARARGRVAELRLRVDDGGDQRRVDPLFVGLLADHILVAQRQRQLLNRFVEAAAGDQVGKPEADEDSDSAGGRPTAAGTYPAAHRRSFASRADSAPSRSATVPSLTTTCSARSAFSAWGSCRASRSSTKA